VSKAAAMLALSLALAGDPPPPPPSVPSPPPLRACQCSPACTCGCAAGGPCRCRTLGSDPPVCTIPAGGAMPGSASVAWVGQHTTPPPAPYYPAATPTFAPAAFGGGWPTVGPPVLPVPVARPVVLPGGC